MTPNVHLHPVAAGELKALSALLERYVPQSLTIIGPIVQAPSDTAEAGIWLWSTAPVLTLEANHTTPAPFAVFLLASAHGNTQCRFFCSSEATSGSATPEEAAFVVHVVQEGLRAAAAVLSESRGEEANPGGGEVRIGSIHEKWTDCLTPHAAWVNPNTKFLCPPRPAAGAPPRRTHALPPGAVLARLTERDADFVIATSHIARSREYIRLRCAQSVCVRVPAAGGGTRPVAWVLVLVDGSLGTLHVEPEFRRAGLATAVVRALVDDTPLDGAAGGERSSEKGEGAAVRRGGALGWFWAEALDFNEKSAGFFRKLEGWEEAWACSWMGFKV